MADQQDEILGVGIEFKLMGGDTLRTQVSEYEGIFARFGQTVSSAMGGQTTAAAAESKKRTTIAQDEAKQQVLLSKQAFAEKLNLQKTHSAESIALTKNAVAAEIAGTTASIAAAKNAMAERMAGLKTGIDAEKIASTERIANHKIEYATTARLELQNREASMQAAKATAQKELQDSKLAAHSRLAAASLAYRKDVDEHRNAEKLKAQAAKGEAQASANQDKEIRRAALAQFKSYDQLEVQYHGVKTKQLVKENNEFLNEKLRMHQLSLKGATEEIRQESALREKAMAEELKGRYRLAQQRPEVQFGGAGAMMNQLGIGRVTSVLSPLSGIGEMSGGQMAMAGGAAALGAVGLAAYGVERAYTAAAGAARKYDDGQNRLAIALTRSGLTGAALRRELENDSSVVDKLSIAFAKPREEIAETMGSLAAYSRESGANLKRITELTIAIGEATGMESTRIARMVGKGMNPEIQADMMRLGIHVDKNATALERLNALEEQYGATVDETKRRMSEGVHGWDKLINQLELAAGRFSDKAFNNLTPLFDELNPLVEKFGDDLAHFDFDKAIINMKGWYHAAILIGDAVGYTARTYAYNVGLIEGAIFDPTGQKAAEANIANGRKRQLAQLDNFTKELLDKNAESAQLRSDLMFGKPFLGTGVEKEKKGKTAEEINREHFAKEREQYDTAYANRLNALRVLVNDEQMTEQQGKLAELQANITYNKALEDLTRGRKGLERDYLQEVRDVARDESDTRRLNQEENKKSAKTEYENEISFLSESSIHRAAFLELDIQDKRKGAKEIYDSRVMYLDAEVKTAEVMYGKESTEYRALVKSRSELDLQYSLQQKQFRNEDQTHALTLTKQLEDKRISVTKDKIERETKEEALRHKRAEDEISKFQTEDERQAASSLEKMTHEESLAKIASDSYDEQEKAGKQYIDAVLSPINSELETAIKNTMHLGAIGDAVFANLTKIGFGLLGKALDKAVFGPAIPAAADGTDDAPGGMMLVGERGPELVNLPKGAKVIPNHKLGFLGAQQQMMAGMEGGGGTDVTEAKLLWEKRREAARKRGEDPDKQHVYNSSDSPISRLAGLGKGAVGGVADIPLALGALARIPGAEKKHEQLRNWIAEGQKPAGFRANDFMAMATPFLAGAGLEAATQSSVGGHIAHVLHKTLEGVHIAEGSEGAKSVAQEAGLLPGFANGTDDAPGGWAQVGERGTEAVMLPPSAGHRIIGNSVQNPAIDTGNDRSLKTLQDIAKATKETSDHTGIMKNGLTGDKGIHKAATGASGLLKSLSPMLNLIAPGSTALFDGIGAGLGLFSEGGYTGDGDPRKPAGIVHKGEYVLNAKETKSLNQPAYQSRAISVNEPAPRYASGGGGFGGGNMSHSDMTTLAAMIGQHMGNAVRSIPPQQISTVDVYAASNRGQGKRNNLYIGA